MIMIGIVCPREGKIGESPEYVKTRYINGRTKSPESRERILFPLVNVSLKTTKFLIAFHRTI